MLSNSVYSLFSALIMHIYQMRSTNSAIKAVTEQRLKTCMDALKEVSKTWLVAKMVHTLFESILGNKVLEEKLQKAAGRKHQREKPTAARGPAKKRKHDDLEGDISNGQPQQQMSYERSRPQSPAMTPSRDLPMHQQQEHQGLHLSGSQQMPNITMSSDSPEAQRNNDAFMGHSRGGTRATTPFNPRGPSMPGTPPELFLTTRHSPTLPPELWNNFQPDQLFPGNAQDLFPPGHTISPEQNQPFIDPALGSHQQQQQTRPGQQQQGYGYQQQHHGMPMGQPQAVPRHMMQNDWNQMGVMQQGQHLDPETWSNSSTSQGPPVPTTLNVEDWFQFIGITGEGGHANLYG